MTASVVTVEPASPLVIPHPREGGDTIQQRDLIAKDGTYVKRASDKADLGTPAANYAALAANFVGLAVGGAHAEDTQDGELNVQADGVAEHPCDPTTWAVGDLVSGAENAAGNGLENQKVAKTTEAGEALGRCIQAGTNLTRVRWVLQPKTLLPAT